MFKDMSEETRLYVWGWACATIMVVTGISFLGAYQIIDRLYKVPPTVDPTPAQYVITIQPKQ